MKVILLRDVAKIGRKNSVIEVPDGYALNQLIPKKWAESATPANLKKIAQNKLVTETQYQNDQMRFDALTKSLLESTLTVVAGQANGQGHLFQAIHEQDIIDAARLRGLTIARGEVVIEQSIKSLGTHTITLKSGNKKVACTIEVIRKT